MSPSITSFGKVDSKILEWWEASKQEAFEGTGRPFSPQSKASAIEQSSTEKRQKQNVLRFAVDLHNMFEMFSKLINIMQIHYWVLKNWYRLEI